MRIIADKTETNKSQAAADTLRQKDGESPIQKKPNNTGLPDNLKAGIESLGGYDMSDVQVHYNSSQPAQLHALAYAQGTDIHIGPGQEQHLPHEAWHIVQQKQGIVKPTKQLKSSVAITPSGATAQLTVNAASFRELLAEQEELAKSVAKSNLAVRSLSAPSAKALPGFDQNKLYNKLSKEGLNIPGKEILPAFVGHFIGEEKAAMEAYTFPEIDWEEFAGFLRKTIGKKLVTAGFEFEFSSMAEKNPFEGVTHVELSKSKEIINNLPFILETDAGNALELVAPPMFLDAIDSEIPLPKPEEAQKVETLIKTRLGEITGEDKTMKTMTEAFKADPGLSFDLGDTKVIPKNLSDRSFGKYTQGHDTVSAADIESIGVGKITKYGHGAIDTQINIATDAASYAVFVELNMANREKNLYVRQFYDLQNDLETAIGTGRFEEPLKGFLRLFVRNIAGQLAIPSMQKIFQKQKEAFEKGSVEKAKGELEFQFYAWASSGVKDIGNIWIKDNIINIGIGILNKAGWGVVSELINKGLLQNAIYKYQVPHYLITMGTAELGAKAAEKVIKENRINLEAYYKEAKAHMLSATKTLAFAIDDLKLTENENDQMIGTPEVPFMVHDPKFIGPRQDTHLQPDKVQLPAWKQRLHVSELRSDPIESLKKWTDAAAGNKAAKEKERLAAEEFEKNAKPYQRYNALLTAKELKDNEIKIVEKFAANIKLTMADYVTIKKRLGNMDVKQREKAMTKARDLSWTKGSHVSRVLATSEAFAEFD